MSERPRFTDAALVAVLRGRAPRKYDRQGRVALIAEAARALLDDKMPSLEAAQFLGGALLAWLERGGSLERDYLKVAAKAGSHHTPAALWQALPETGSSRGAPGAESSPMIDSSLEPSPMKRSSKK